jgi:plasmid stabilization system protein ParE
MARLIWTIQAAEDLENIFSYISKDSIKYARIQVIRIREQVNILKNHPQMGRIVPEVGNENLREVIFGSYRIIYRYNSGNLIEIITIHHSAMLLKL